MTIVVRYIDGWQIKILFIVKINIRGVFTIKYNIIKKTSVVIGALVMALSGSVGAVFAESPQINSNASITVDYNTGQILQADNHDVELGIASITKIIVEYILFEEIDSGSLRWDDVVEISDYAYEIGTDYRLSNIPLNQYDKYTVRDMYDALTLKSANAATIALAEKIEGSEPAFVDRMIKTVESFGVEDAKLYNTTGLPNRFIGENIYPGSTSEDENSMSARSVAKIADRIIKDYPEILETSKLPSKIFAEGTDHSFWMHSTNQMLPGGSHERAGVDGLKTGTTNFAGRTFVGTSSENDRRLITVVLNSKENRFKDTNELMDYGFNNFELKRVTNGFNNDWKDVIDYEPIRVTRGNKKSINYRIDGHLDFLVEKGCNVKDDYEFKVNLDGGNVSKDGELIAPISAGDNIGHLEISKVNSEYGYLNEKLERKIPIMADESIRKEHIVIRSWNELTLLIESIGERAFYSKPPFNISK